MEKFATRPLTAGNMLARLNSATLQQGSPANGPRLQSVQIKEFGDKQRQWNGSAMSFHSMARPASAQPAFGKPAVIYSTISKDLKLELKRHVPLYKHREMGKIMYRETDSKIVRPPTASSSYKGMLKQPMVSKFSKTEADQTFGPRTADKRLKKIIKVGAEIHTKPEYLADRAYAKQGRNASIMGADYNRDNVLDSNLASFFRCNPCGVDPRVPVHDRHMRVKRNLEILEQLDNEMNSVNQRQADQWRRRSTFTVSDAAKRQSALDYYRPERVIFENDSNFITLAKVKD